MSLGAARTAQQAAWRSYAAANARRTGTASTNASITYTAGGAVTSTAQYKFGTASEYVATSNDEIATTAGSPSYMNFGTDEFTIEMWIYIPTVGSGHSQSCDVMSNDTSNGFGFRLAQSYNTNSLNTANARFLNIFARQQADLDYWDLGSTWPAAAWNFVVIQRKGTTMSCWVNGTLLTRSDGSGGSGGTRDFSSGTSILIGTADGSNGVGPAYIDELCVSNTYRYTDDTSNIPVPTAAFTLDSYTSQLMHMDGANGGTTFVNETS
jgi:hypothetical protein